MALRRRGSFLIRALRGGPRVPRPLRDPAAGLPKTEIRATGRMALTISVRSTAGARPRTSRRSTRDRHSLPCGPPTPAGCRAPPRRLRTLDRRGACGRRREGLRSTFVPSPQRASEVNAGVQSVAFPPPAPSIPVTSGQRVCGIFVRYSRWRAILVTGMQNGAEWSLGTDSRGNERANTEPCP